MNKNIDFRKIKLIIWDLDETLWEGTLSEGEVHISSQNINLIKLLTDCGIINSICSKNDIEPVESKLKEFGIDSYFVFKSIDWNPKGQRVYDIVSSMSLRFPNVLFIDDNIQNLKEVEHYCDGIMCHEPSIINDLFNYYNKVEKNDLTHKRLNQYKTLEAKHNESLSFPDNESFLRSCNISVQIKKDCINNLDRIHELVLRTNQLNFTKIRVSKDELLESIENCDDCGYVTVKDKFGDYGIVGFYLIKEQRFEHFLFSCRTIGQGIENYIYNKLGNLPIDIIQPVIGKLDNNIPDWIFEDNNNENTNKSTIKSDNKYLINILIKGPCDMSNMATYLKIGANIDTEFTFLDDKGRSIETHNHPIHILTYKTLDKDRLNRIFKECSFLSENNFNTNIFSDKYDFIILSTLINGNIGIYKRKLTGEKIAFGHYDYPLTDKNFHKKYIMGEVPCYGFKLTQEDIDNFCRNYEYCGRITPDEYIQFLDFLSKQLNKKTICLLLGSEIKYDKETESSYMDRHIYHKELNSKIKEYALTNPHIKYIEVTKHIKSQNDFTNNINHYTPRVYYNITTDIISIIKEEFNYIKTANANKLILFIKNIQLILIKYISVDSKFYKLVRNAIIKLIK
ncbi:MAG: HAD-IIIC family phosphatase [Bacteroidales bacterium]|nr:HAD-IIIC family phosphatase [Bacteroidales bacterium]